MTVQVVGGPNERTDYHDDPVEEFFYQLKGDMVLKVVDNGELLRRSDSRGRGLPAAAACAAFAATAAGGSIGLVVEAARPHELDAFEWYCFECGSAGPPDRGEGATSGEGFAAALRGVLSKRRLHARVSGAAPFIPAKSRRPVGRRFEGRVPGSCLAEPVEVGPAARLDRLGSATGMTIGVDAAVRLNPVTDRYFSTAFLFQLIRCRGGRARRQSRRGSLAAHPEWRPPNRHIRGVAGRRCGQQDARSLPDRDAMTS